MERCAEAHLRMCKAHAEVWCPDLPVLGRCRKSNGQDFHEHSPNFVRALLVEKKRKDLGGVGACPHLSAKRTGRKPL